VYSFFRLGLGVKGAAYAITCCTATNSLLLTAYQTYRDAVLLKGTPQATWSGYSTAAFRGWWQVGCYLYMFFTCVMTLLHVTGRLCC
jgi:hypothetical protein